MRFATGLLRSPEPPALRFRSYLVGGVLPIVPPIFGHYGLLQWDGWKMLGNDSVGDCAIAGPMHCSMLWNAIANRPVRFTTLDALDDYSAITGYNRSDPASDTGTDMVVAAKYWQKTGFRDSQAHRHQIAAYMTVDPKRLDAVHAAAYLFGAVGLGVEIPSTAQDQFMAQRPWAVTPNEQIEGYHYVPLVGRKPNGNSVVITWGATQEVELGWLQAHLQEVVAIISQEQMVSGKSPEGYDFAALQDDLSLIAG